MDKAYKKGLFIFRRDFRLSDNAGFIEAMSMCEQVLLCFIFDKRQVGSENDYKSNNAIQFMLGSLKDLEQQIKKIGGKLYFFYGGSEKIIKKLIMSEDIQAVFCNRDYTPFSIKRDKALYKLCLKKDVDFIQNNSVLLNEPEEIMTGGGTPYAVFTPYYNKASKIKVEKPKKIPRKKSSFVKKRISFDEGLAIFKKILKKENKEILLNGGRKEALGILKSLKTFKDYAEDRDFPAIPTTHLSAHLKFGTVSVQEVYYAIVKYLGANHPLLRQLYWRDFWVYVAFHSPFVFGQPFREKYKKLKWSKNKTLFKAWCEGKTGFPIVDAGMRQLNTTGFMHNRVRMIVGSFLTKDLHIDWRMGEKYFAQRLIDYDPAVNNGNWQWVASTGCDAQPYFRIFNPWRQQKKFDPDCVYIKHWIPELKQVDAKVIHAWNKKHTKAVEYPKPIVDHAIEAQKAKLWFKAV